MHYSHHTVGIAYQIRDDTLDLVGESDKLGTPVSSDQRQGKMSLATLFALRSSEKFKKALSSEDSTQASLLLRHTGALEYAMQKAREYSERAKG